MPSGLLGLEVNPFREGHDARFLYPSHAHWEAVSRLRRAIDDREPFVYLTGPAGCGKTTALLEFLAGMESHTAVVIAAARSLTRTEFRERMLSGLGCESPGPSTPERLADRVETQLREMHARGDQVILVVDESQNLSPELLEELMALSDLETGGRTLLQVILAGQPVLERLLSLPGCEALRPRITARCWLGAFSAEETEGYIRHRISVVPGASRSLFPSDSCQAVHRLTHGCPRDINLLASQALVQAEAAGARTVKPDHVAAAARVMGLVYLPPPLPQGLGARRGAVAGLETTRRGRPWGPMAWAAGALIIVAVGYLSSVMSRAPARGAAAHRPATAAPAAWTPPPAAVPKAIHDVAAPRAPVRRYGIEVATFIVETRAVEERDKLAGGIPVGCRVVTSHEDEASVYHVVVGPLTSRSEAESLGADLFGRGVVGEARVVRWTATESTHR